MQASWSSQPDLPFPHVDENRDPNCVICPAEMTVLSHRGIPSAALFFFFFLAIEEILFLIGVYYKTTAQPLIWPYSNKVANILVSPKPPKIIQKNGRFLKAGSCLVHSPLFDYVVALCLGDEYVCIYFLLTVLC